MWSKPRGTMPISNKEASTCVRVIVEHIVMRWGLMHEIQSHQGPEFQADLSLQLYDDLGIDKVNRL